MLLSPTGKDSSRIHDNDSSIDLSYSEESEHSGRINQQGGSGGPPDTPVKGNECINESTSSGSGIAPATGGSPLVASCPSSSEVEHARKEPAGHPASEHGDCGGVAGAGGGAAAEPEIEAAFDHPADSLRYISAVRCLKKDSSARIVSGDPPLSCNLRSNRPVSTQEPVVTCVPDTVDSNPSHGPQDPGPTCRTESITIGPGSATTDVGPITNGKSLGSFESIEGGVNDRGWDALSIVSKVIANAFITGSSPVVFRDVAKAVAQTCSSARATLACVPRPSRANAWVGRDDGPPRPPRAWADGGTEFVLRRATLSGKGNAVRFRERARATEEAARALAEGGARAICLDGLDLVAAARGLAGAGAGALERLRADRLSSAHDAAAWRSLADSGAFARLVELDVTVAESSRASAEGLRALLPGAPALERLRIAETHVTPKMARALAAGARAREEGRGLDALSLYGCDSPDWDATISAISGAVRRALDLSWTTLVVRLDADDHFDARAAVCGWCAGDTGRVLRAAPLSRAMMGGRCPDAMMGALRNRPFAPDAWWR